MASRSPVTVSVVWLQEQLSTVSGKKNTRIVDGTWHKPVWKRDAGAEYVSEHIEGAVWFDLDEICDKTAPLPQAMPSTEQFSEQVGKLGISNDDHVVVYDNNENYGMYSSSRVWYMFKLFGHDKVSILDGGLPKWKAGGGKTVSGPQSVAAKEYKATFRKDLYKSFEQVLNAYNEKTVLILDARSPGRFEGTDPEPVPEIPSGHIIGTKNLFWKNLIDPSTKTLKTPEELKQVFASHGVSLDRPIIATCGSGMTACWIALAAEAADNQEIPVYVGSWLEWYARGPTESKTIGVKGEDL